MIMKITLVAILSTGLMASWGSSVVKKVKKTAKKVEKKAVSTTHSVVDTTGEVAGEVVDAHVKVVDTHNQLIYDAHKSVYDAHENAANWAIDRTKSETDRIMKKVENEIDTLYGGYNDVKNGLTDAFYKQKRCIEAAMGRASTIEKCKMDFVKDLKDEQQNYGEMQMDELDRRNREIPNETEERLTFDNDDTSTNENTSIATPEEYNYVADEPTTTTTDDTYVTEDDTTTPVVDTYIDTRDDTYTATATPSSYSAPRAAPRSNGISYSSDTRRNKSIRSSGGGGGEDELELEERRCIERGGDFEICRESVLDSNNEDEKASFFRERQ